MADATKDTSPSVGKSSSRSRRLFLKTVGAVAVGAATAPLTPPHETYATTVPVEVPPDVIETALNIAKADPMYQQAITELKAWSLEFDDTAKDARLPSVQGSLVGLALHNRTTTSPRFGGDLALTTDLGTQSLRAVQFVLGWSWTDRLHIEGTTFDVRLPLYPEIVNPCALGGQPSPLVRPRHVRAWDFLRPDPPPEKPEEMVNVGWSPETPGTCYWHYNGCMEAAWIQDGDVTIYRCTKVVEEQACDPKPQRVLELTYVSPKPESDKSSQ